MDREQFEQDVWASVNDSLYSDQWGSMDETDRVVTIGETWQGALYGASENTYGQRAVYQFDTEAEQRAWFEGVTIDDSPANW